MPCGHRGVRLWTPARFSFQARGADVGAPAAYPAAAFANGATEAWLAPPLGDHRFRLELVGNAQGELMSTSAPIDVKVVKTPAQ